MRNMFIVVEGPDNVGKTTLIKNLKDHFNDITFHTLHYTNVKHPSSEELIKYSAKLYEEMFGLMSFVSTKEKSGVICDRSHLGELIYGPIYRGYTGAYVLDIERTFKHIRPVWDNLVLITLYDEPENLISREDGLSFSTDLEKKKTEIENFKAAHEKSLIQHKMLLNIKDRSAQQVTQAVVGFLSS